MALAKHNGPPMNKAKRHNSGGQSHNIPDLGLKSGLAGLGGLVRTSPAVRKPAMGRTDKAFLLSSKEGSPSGRLEIGSDSDLLPLRG